MSFTVAIVGRPNVGKSTLFNRLIGGRKAIVDDESGVTRDRQYGICEWNGKHFNIIDTGGFVPNSEDIFEAAIRDQVHIAIEQADHILFMVDVTTGITNLDDAVADLLRKAGKPVFLVVNKVDNHTRSIDATEFYGLGIENLYMLSSISGSGTGDLLDALTATIPEDEEFKQSEIPRVAIIGQPNVGKSSLLNALLGEERNIVTDVAGTTRDTIHTPFKKFDREMLLIDTAGIRKKSKVHENIEFYSVIRAIRAMDESDVVMLLIDAKEGLEMQDLKIYKLAQKKRKGIVIVVNKWDLIDHKETNTARDYEEEVRERLQPFKDVPIVFVSVLEKQRVLKALDAVTKVFENRKKRIPTSELNEVMLKAVERAHPPAYRGAHIKIKYVTQLPTYTPQFAFFCNHPKFIKQPYKNYLENQIRESFDFHGVPIEVYFRKK